MHNPTWKYNVGVAMSHRRRFYWLEGGPKSRPREAVR